MSAFSGLSFTERAGQVSQVGGNRCSPLVEGVLRSDPGTATMPE